jgi:tRNA (guanine-N(7)-)-methyltransferase subunit TRM82
VNGKHWGAPSADERMHADMVNRVPALFIFQLQTDNALLHRGTLELGGNALDIAVLGVANQALLVAVDGASSDGEILVFERNGKSWTPRDSILGTTDVDEQPLLSREDLDKALYTAENLRKTGNEEGGDEAASDMPRQGSEIKID